MCYKRWQCSYIALALPKSPVNLSASNVGPTTVQLTWSAGSTDPVDSYIVRHRLRHTELSSDETIDIAVTQHTLSELIPHTSYTVDVFAVNNIGRSLPASIEVTTAEDGLYYYFAICLG